jgi:hypothetical protein
MLISEAYRSLNQDLHAQGSFGRYGDKWAERVRGLIAELRPATVLDYGCGQGTLKRALDFPIIEYDPAIPGKDTLPQPADLVICTDVLEHVEPDCLQSVLDHLMDLTKGHLFAVISTRPASKLLADGRNAHLIVEPWSFWRDQLSRRFVLTQQVEHQDEVEILLLRSDLLLCSEELVRLQSATRADVGNLTALADEVLREVRDRELTRTLVALSREQAASISLLRHEQAQDRFQSSQAFASLVAEVGKRHTLEGLLASERDARESAKADFQRASAERDAAQAEVRELRNSLAEESAALEACRIELAAGAAALEAKQMELAASDARLARAQGELTTIQVELETLACELKVVKRKYRSVQAEVEREKQQGEVTASQLDETLAELQQYHDTLPWKIYDRVTSGIQSLRNYRLRFNGDPDRHRYRQWAAALRESALFDRAWYLAAYPDVAASGIDPLDHYVRVGWREGRDPGPDFRSSDYLKANPDVAASGINPLVHYVEFGRSEGRYLSVRSNLKSNEVDSPDRRLHASIDPDVHFGMATPVFQMPVADYGPVRWKRHYQLAQNCAEALCFSGTPVGHGGNGLPRAQLAGKAAQFRRLSGIDVEPNAFVCPQDWPAARPIDAWFAGHGDLRLRWQRSIGDGPFVIRAFQRDPNGLAEAVLVGEGLVRDELDLFDAVLINPFFPVLFVFAEPDGALLGAEIMPFPSMRRGGAHYAEALLEGDEVRLAAQLAAVAHGDAAPLVSDIMIDLSGADGTQLSFLPDLRDWLALVARVGLAPLHAPADMLAPSAAWLAQAAGLRPQAGRRKTGHALHLACDMIPAIGVLAALASRPAPPGKANLQALPLLVLSADPAVAPRLFAMPPVEAAALGQVAPASPLAFPVINGPVGELEGIRAAALRRVARNPTEAEMLCPVSAPMLVLPDHDPDITVVISSAEWNEAELLHALQALALQTCRESLTINFAGTAPPAVAAAAARLFPMRSATYADCAAAFSAAMTTFSAWLGAGIILHDERTLALLTGFLAPKTISTVGCVVVRSFKRGKSWHVSPVGTDVFTPIDAPQIWRSTIPVVKPQAGPWVARTSVLKAQLRGGEESAANSAGLHLYTSLVTASYCSAPLADEAIEMAPELVVSDRAVTIEVLAA